jgi:hypothetical protein
MAIRRIYCESCGNKWPGPDPEDIANHWHFRPLHIIAKKPTEHFIKITDSKTGQTERSDLPTLLCDHCGQPIPDGAPAIAYTVWRGSIEPPVWENNYTAKPKL